MKTLLITLNAKYIHTSLALRYLRAYALPEHQVELIEYSINQPLEELTYEICEKKPEVVAFSCYIWNIEQTLELIRMLSLKLPELTIILGGPEVSYELSYWLEREPAIDYIVYGEGERSLKELLDYLHGSRNLEDLKGIAFRMNEGIVIAQPQELLELDSIPSPYQHEDLSKLRNRVVYFEASRGCPFSCSYCLSSLDSRVRFFSIKRVKAELTRLLAADIKLIKFVDRTFNIKQDFAIEIFDFLVNYYQQHNSQTVFQFEITADLLSNKLIDYLVECVPSGLFRFEIGVQSTNDLTNRLINRQQDWQRLSETIVRLQEKGNIELHLDLIAGLPEEDLSSFRNSFDQVFALGASELQLGFLKMLRGTAIWHDQHVYDYVYDAKPPYEVLSNKVLSENDIAAIKLVEQMLNRYWNTSYLRQTITYLTREVYLSSFDLFLKLGQYWEEQGWSLIGYQLEELFGRLYQFLEQEDLVKIEFIYDLMKYEFFTHFKHKPRRVWWPYIFDRKMQSARLEELVAHPELAEKVEIDQQIDPSSSSFANLKLTKQEMEKHIMIDQLKYDLPHYLKSGEVRKQSLLHLIYFDFVDKSKAYYVRIK